jgi:hypothetical protein
MRTIGMTGELDKFARGQLQDILEAPADSEEDLLALIGGASLAAGHVAVSASWNALPYGASPDTDAEEGLADVDDDAHHLAVLLILERLADGRHHDMQPEVVDVDAALVLELVGPLAAMLVLGVFPFGPDALLEEVVV